MDRDFPKLVPGARPRNLIVKVVRISHDGSHSAKDWLVITSNALEGRIVSGRRFASASAALAFAAEILAGHGLVNRPSMRSVISGDGQREVS